MQEFCLNGRQIHFIEISIQELPKVRRFSLKVPRASQKESHLIFDLLKNMQLTLTNSSFQKKGSLIIVARNGHNFPLNGQPCFKYVKDSLKHVQRNCHNYSQLQKTKHFPNPLLASCDLNPANNDDNKGTLYNQGNASVLQKKARFSIFAPILLQFTSI